MVWYSLKVKYGRVMEGNDVGTCSLTDLLACKILVYYHLPKSVLLLAL